MRGSQHALILGLIANRCANCVEQSKSSIGCCDDVAKKVWDGRNTMWNQVYNPFGNAVLSTCAAALPVVTLLVLIASNKVKAHIAAVIALIVANLIAIFISTMPADMSLRATVLGAVIGFFPIGWIVLNVIFLYRLTVERGAFQTLQSTIGGGTSDR